MRRLTVWEDRREDPWWQEKIANGQMNWDASKEEAIEVLDKVFRSEWLTQQVFEMIDEQAYDMGLKTIEQ